MKDEEIKRLAKVLANDQVFKGVWQELIEFGVARFDTLYDIDHDTGAEGVISVSWSVNDGKLKCEHHVPFLDLHTPDAIEKSKKIFEHCLSATTCRHCEL